MKLFFAIALLTFVTVPTVIAAEGGEIVMAFGQSDFTVGAAVGEEVDVLVQTIGLGKFAAPPVVSSDALTYVGVFDVVPGNGGVARQLFRFKAAKAGPVTVTFHQIDTGREDSYKTIVDSFEVH